MDHGSASIEPQDNHDIMISSIIITHGVSYFLVAAGQSCPRCRWTGLQSVEYGTPLGVLWAGLMSIQWAGLMGIRCEGIVG